MALQQGTRLGAYEIISPLGAGGMGEVYRAHDTRLQRDVALKILPETMARDAQRMARFEREAQVLASLNHPNIAAIYGLEESNGVRALVMELVDGQTLAESIPVAAVSPPPARRGEFTSPHGGVKPPLQIDDALPIARQIAEALEYAHEHGVIHRDLKPANVKITPEGTVKVLDFGLAKVLEAPDSTATMDVANSPTLSAMATQAGMILGTAAYMSPEQAKGQQVDRRADIWAFGCVLFEMLSGRKPFEGETISEVLASVIKTEPDWTAIPDITPPSIQRLVRRCLQKDQRQRLQAIGEARISIEETLSGTGVSPVEVHGQDAHAATAAPGSPLRRVLPWAGMVVLAIVAAVFGVGYFARAPKPQPVIRFGVSPSAGMSLSDYSGWMSLSPDGSKLAFVAASSTTRPGQLWVRPINSVTAQPLQGTGGAHFPFWSPDGNYLGFYAKGKLWKVATSGGTPQTLCEAVWGGATWSKNGVIVFSNNDRLYSVSDAGGTPTLVAALDADAAGKDLFFAFPQFLPDGRHFLFFTGASSGLNVAAGSLDSKKTERLVHADSNAVFVPPGYLFYTSGTTLMARAFDAQRLQFTGQAVPTAQNLSRATIGGIAYFSASPSGVLAYQTAASGSLISQMVWLNRKGEKLGTVGEPGAYSNPALSPDGTKLAVGVGQRGNRDIWVYDLKRGAASRLTFNPADDLNPVWSGDESRILFTSDRQGQYDLYQKAANGLGNTQPLFESKQVKYLDDLSPDGRYAIYDTTQPFEYWVLPLFGERKPFAFIRGNFNALEARFSPNGRYVAYSSNDTGNDEVYIQTFPQHMGKWHVSTSGGSGPMWRPDGKELFYIGPKGEVMAVAVNTDSAQLQAGIPMPLFQPHLIAVLWRNRYVVSPDGQRFLMLVPPGEAKPEPITVVVNWPALLTKQ